MKQLFHLSLSLLFSCLLSGFLEAQSSTNAYFIQVATYADPQYKDFSKIHSLGYLFAEAQDNGLYKVRMGTYNSYNNAKRILTAIQAKGYKDAYIQKVPITEADGVYIVQLATVDKNDDIYWGNWQRLSDKLCLQLSETQIRIASGPYYTRAEADESLAAALKRGARKDVFVRRVSLKVLHSLTDFEMQRSSTYKQKAKAERVSIKLLQTALNQAGYYTDKVDGLWGNNTATALEKFTSSDETYTKYQVLSEQAVYNHKVENYTLQYYINLIDTDPFGADEGLKQFQHPLAKVYRAYMYLNNDVKIENMNQKVNSLMNEAILQTFKGYRLKTRYDFSMNYAYNDIEQLIKHLREIHEAVVDEPDVPCWLFRKHPKVASTAFSPFWNNERDEFHISSDCGSFLDLPQMQQLLTIAHDMSDKKDNKHLSKINHLFAFPNALPFDTINELDAWNTKIWQHLDAWGKQSPLQSKTYFALKVAYYDALRVVENYYLQKGFSLKDARALGLQTLKYAVGCSLDAYCK